MSTQSSKNPQSDHRLAFVSTLLGGLMTLVGASDRFGLSGALILVAALFLAVGLLYLSESQRFAKVWDRAKVFGQSPQHFFVVAGAVLVLGLVLYVSDVASIRLARKHLPLLIPNLQMRDVKILEDRFPMQLTGIEKSGEDAERAEHASASLLKWAGVYKNTDKHEQLYYVESESIPENCDDVRVSCVVPEMIVSEVAAYLVSPARGALLWQRPNMRKQFHFLTENRIVVSLDQPSQGDRLVLLIHALSYTPQTKVQGMKDAAEPDDLFKNSYFEFE